MNGHEKAAQALGTCAASISSSRAANHNASASLREQFDGEKPSRQNRRPKRSWKRPPKKALDMPTAAWHCGCTVLETPSKAVTAPVSLSGIFTTIGFSMAGSGQSIQHPLRESCQRTLDRFEVPATPYRAGLIEKSKGITMQTIIGVTRHTSLSLYVYRFVRHFAGPVLSYRLARFARRAAA